MLKKPLILLLVFLFLALLVFIGNSFGPLKFIAEFTQGIFSYPRALVYDLSKGNSESEDLKKIKNENETLTKKVVDFDKLKRDNDALRSQFENAKSSEYKFVPSKVLGFDGGILKPSTLVLDQGSENGIKVGMAAVSGSKLVGKISKVQPHFSVLTLTTNPKFTTLVQTADTNAKGVISGNEDFILLDRVSVNEKLNKDAILLSAGQIDSDGVGIPKDFEIGKISSVNRSQSLPFQTAKIEKQINFSNLEIVFIVAGIK